MKAIPSIILQCTSSSIPWEGRVKQLQYCPALSGSQETLKTPVTFMLGIVEIHVHPQLKSIECQAVLQFHTLAEPMGLSYLSCFFFLSQRRLSVAICWFPFSICITSLLSWYTQVWMALKSSSKKAKFVPWLSECKWAFVVVQAGFVTLNFFYSALLSSQFILDWHSTPDTFLLQLIFSQSFLGSCTTVLFFLINNWAVCYCMFHLEDIKDQ